MRRQFSILTALLILAGIVYYSHSTNQSGHSFTPLNADSRTSHKETSISEPCCEERIQSIVSNKEMSLPDYSTITSKYKWYTVYFTDPDTAVKSENESVSIIQGFVDLIDTSQHKIDIAVYQMDIEAIKTSLLQAASRGVQIRIITDSDSFYTPSIFPDLMQNDIPVITDHRSSIMHQKFAIFDQYTLWTGSWNFTENCTYRNNNNAISIRSSELAHYYEEEFNEMYIQNFFGTHSPKNNEKTQVYVADTLIEICFAPEDNCSQQVIELLKTAKSSIRFMAFSFTQQEIAAIIIQQAISGIDIQGVIESQMSVTSYSVYDELLEANINVIKDKNPDAMHHKIIIIDDEIVLLGSYNFTRNGDLMNDENLLIIHNKEIAGMYLFEFEKIWQQAFAQ